MGQPSLTVYACQTCPPNVLGDVLLYTSTKLGLYLVCCNYKESSKVGKQDDGCLACSSQYICCVRMRE